MTFNLIVALVGTSCLFGSRYWHFHSIYAFQYDEQKSGEKYSFRSMWMFAAAFIAIWILFLRGV